MAPFFILQVLGVLGYPTPILVVLEGAVVTFVCTMQGS